jgi:hypothetical protein
MPDFPRLNRYLRRAIWWLAWANLSLLVAIAWVLSRSLLPTPSVGSATGQSAFQADATPASVSEAEAADAMRGKAPFRTARMVKPKVVDESGAYALVGVSLRAGQGRAYIRDTKMKKLYIKQVGETLGSYEIDAITQEGITLARGAERVLLVR